MLAPFQLSQPSLINWKQVFLGYTNKMYINPEDRTIFRTVEDEVEEMTRINRLICFNLDLKMDTIWLESLEAYYITYVSWLQVVNMNFEFGTQNVKSLSQKFSVTNPYENEAVSHSQIEIEIYWLKYNIACINFAKGNSYLLLVSDINLN